MAGLTTCHDFFIKELFHNAIAKFLIGKSHQWRFGIQEILIPELNLIASSSIVLSPPEGKV